LVYELKPEAVNEFPAWSRYRDSDVKDKYDDDSEEYFKSVRDVLKRLG
jgi:hypothetical protein